MKTKKLVCYNCDGHGFITATYENGQTSAICPVCGGIGTHEIQMTNADRIRAMTDEELNELFHEIYNAGAEDAVAYEWGQRTNSFEWTTEWLQQPAGEEDKHEQTD